MLTKKQVLDAVKAGRESQCLDGRDYSRLTNYFLTSKWKTFGFELKEGADPPKLKSWTKKNILNDLEGDVAFGFEKALDCRGISASFMNEVVKMWLWILDDLLQHHTEYAQYGLPLLKAVAEKYGFSNEIGESAGSEMKYEEQY